MQKRNPFDEMMGAAVLELLPLAKMKSSGNAALIKKGVLIMWKECKASLKPGEGGGYILAVLLAVQPLLASDMELGSFNGRLKAGIRLLVAVIAALLGRYLANRQKVEEKKNGGAA